MCVCLSTCCIKSVPSLPQQLSLSSFPICRAKSHFLLVSLLPWPSPHLPVRPPTTHCIMPCLHQMKCSCQAPYLNIWSNRSPLHVPPLTHLLSHEEIKLPVTTFKEFLSSPCTYHPCWISSPPTSSHLQQHCSPQRSTCWHLISLLSCTPCFFCRAAMSHPCISIYIQFSEKTTCTSLPTDCNPPWPKLQRLFRKSLTHYR